MKNSRCRTADGAYSVDHRRRLPLDSRLALHRIIDKLGSQAELVRRLGMKPSQASTVRWWCTRGVVPAKWVHRVATVGGVSVMELVADWPDRRQFKAKSNEAESYEH